MTNLYRMALLGSLFAIAVSGCANEAATDDPVVEEMVEELPVITPEEQALINQGTEASDTSDTSGDGSGAMESGSNDEGARQPDPKRTKLIKADPS
ncbi:MAG: hypothetical protein AAFZ11_05525 [Pseudomonadota bacterium]